MDKPLILVESITYAIKGRDILNRNGFRAIIQKIIKNKELKGCGYAIYVKERADEAADFLNKSGIKVVSRTDWGH